jgi:mevalonate kinase
MSSTTATAPGKVILFGEHAVVYGRAAIAVPVTKVRATATVEDALPGTGCTIAAPDIGVRIRLSDALAHPLAVAVRLAAEAAGIQAEPDWNVTVGSTIPIAGGMGSGAAVGAALARAVLSHSASPSSGSPAAETVNRIVYAVEELHHATPSGIDNTVVVYEQPVWFVRGQQPQVFDIALPFHLVIADTGIASSTGKVVADVRRAWQEDTKRYEAIFDRIGVLAEAARRSIGAGDVDSLGPMMQENQRLLRQLDVSAEPLERLIAIAEKAGATGAKLSGAGRGGNLIAVVEPENLEAVQEALLTGGAAGVVVTEVGA